MKAYLTRIVIAGALIAISLAAAGRLPSANGIRMAAHEKTPMHELSARLVIWLTDAHLRDTKPDGTVTDYRRAAGSTEWVPAQRHAGENLSAAPIEFLAVVPKTGAGAGGRD